MRFSTMPLSLVDALPDPLAFHRKWNQILTSEESRDVALAAIGLRGVPRKHGNRYPLQFVKEGHTSSVWLDEKSDRIINVARDRNSASEDLVSSFTKLKQIKDPRVARVVDIGSALGVPFAIVEHVRESFELTLAEDRKTFGRVVSFNSGAEPTIEWLNDRESASVFAGILDIEKALDLTLTVLHGDVVIQPKCSLDITVVACDGFADHYVPFTHREGVS